METQPRTPTDETDVIILGGGPAGAAASLALAKHGRSVLLLEKSQFPRYHVGESMVPYLTRLLGNLGLREQVEELGFVPKHGVEVFDEEGTLRRAPFEMLAPGQTPLAYQLDRERFDALVLDRAEPLLSELAAAHAQVMNGDPEWFSSGATTDARSFNLYGSIPATCYGPEAQNIHGIDESVSLDSTLRVAQVLALFVTRWCGVEKTQ